jgi:hypothetical protein
MAIAKQNVQRRLAAGTSSSGQNPTAPIFARLLRADGVEPLDGLAAMSQTDMA